MKNIDLLIKNRDKNALYILHMKRIIDDDKLIDAIIKIDDSVVSKKTRFLKLLHDIIFPSCIDKKNFKL
jgi:hypothetical protein